MPDNDIMFAFVFVNDVVCSGSGVVVFLLLFCSVFAICGQKSLHVVQS